MNIHRLFRRSRIQLALWFTVVMGGILSLSGFAVYRSIVQSNWNALAQEIESIAGTLHDSLEPTLPVSGNPAFVLQQIFPDLCLSGQACNLSPTLIQRHTTGISDRNIYYIRLFNYQGKLLAFSPNQAAQLPKTLNSAAWQTITLVDGSRYLQFTTILHSSSAETNHSSWGYLQIGRSLVAFDAETNRIQWILGVSFAIALGIVATSGWWLSGLAMQPIYRAYQQQQQFIANASHELRSPLASLLATVEALIHLPSLSQDHTQKMLPTIERQGRRLSDLIKDLLLLASLEQDSLPLVTKPCCLNDLINDLTEEFLELAIAADVRLNSQVPLLEIYVLGHESQLYRLVSNLIANAIQYTPSGGEVILSLEFGDCGNHSFDRLALIKVKDTGIGISLEQQRCIFERFYRVDSDRSYGYRNRSRRTGGTGLGLAIARAIVHQHQGQLSLQSEIDQGSLFMIQLPRIQKFSR